MPRTFGEIAGFPRGRVANTSELRGVRRVRRPVLWHLGVPSTFSIRGGKAELVSSSRFPVSSYCGVAPGTANVDESSLLPTP